MQMKNYNIKGERIDIKESDYNKENLLTFNDIEVNILTKKSFLDKHFYKILFVVLVVAYLVKKNYLTFEISM